ncbi:MAG: RAM signaling network component [Candelina mexicana]|nr:MAG: RAM signaling network component [Candelina mexicana]
MYRPERGKRVPHPSDGLDETRENIDGFTTMEASFYPGRYPPGYSYPTRYIGPSQQSMAQMPPSISSNQVIALAQQAVAAARQETQRSVNGAGSVNGSIRPGLTIDLGHKNIQRIPEEVVYIIKDEIERLALPHNQIWAFPHKFSYCTRLRYLNVRSNTLREFPRAEICKLDSLEILDLSRNRLRALPEEIGGLMSLKVFSVQKNRLEKLPLSLGDINSLLVLKLEGNPLVFPPKEILEPVGLDPLLVNTNENEKDAIITTQVKRFLQVRKAVGRSDLESGGESSEGLIQTPRPAKRVVSGRFPVKVSTSGSESALDEPVPVVAKPPPIPSRSHYRIDSQESAALRRPGVTPLIIGNERSRSNSESVLQATRAKRMGMVTRKTSDLGTVDETRSTRHSHYRGLSHGSVMHEKQSHGARSGSNNRSNPGSPVDTERQRGTFVRRLSSLPEYKRESVSSNPIIDGAKGVLYALFQVHPQLAGLVIVVRTGSSKRTSLERVFYNASTHVEELDRALQKFNIFAEEDEEPQVRSTEGVLNACSTSLLAYGHVNTLLVRDIRRLVLRADHRYIRTLSLLAYGSLIELRNACFGFYSHSKAKHPTSQRHQDKRQRDQSITPTRERPNPARRLRTVTVVQHSPGTTSSEKHHIPPLGLTSNGRSNTLTSSFMATPRSAESFQRSGASLPGSRSNTMQRTDDAVEERKFEKIFLHLSVAYSAAQKALPTLQREIIRCLEGARARNGYGKAELICLDLNEKTGSAILATEALKRRLSTVKLKEPGVRVQREFWQLCAFVAMVMDVRTARGYGLLSPDIQQVLQPVYKAAKEAGKLIDESPWKDLVDALPPPSHLPPIHTPPPPITESMMHNLSLYGPNSGPSTSSVPTPASYVTPLPPTPLSAALGPAAQATVPSAPSAYPSGPFSGNVFERAESLLSMPTRR